MIGICDISTFIPEKTIDNYLRGKKLGFDRTFIDNKIGIKSLSIKSPETDTSDLCCSAYRALLKNNPLLDPQKIDVIVVCTQNPDCNLPHTSAIIHGKFDLPDSCAAFDISLGCSGFVYGLAIIESFMRNSEMSNGIFITADPYSKIVDESDKNTSLLFGDASTATYIGKNPTFISGKYTFGTLGKNYASLICNNNTLSMNGRNVFNFLAEKIPTDIAKVLRINNLTLEDIDLFLLHQGSKYIIDFLIQKTPLPKDKTPFAIENYGNTVSSSIPLMLSDFIKNNSTRKILMSGFGVGLSWASGILIRVKEGE